MTFGTSVWTTLIATLAGLVLAAASADAAPVTNITYHAYNDAAQGADTISPFGTVFGAITEQDPNGIAGEPDISLYDFRGLGPAPLPRQTYFFLEDLHDGQFDAPGATLNGSVRTDDGRNGSVNAGSNTDSVDEDDAGGADGVYGSPRGSTRGASRFDFDERVLGVLPSHVGVVYTDQSSGTLNAYDRHGNLLESATVTGGPDPFAGIVSGSQEQGIAYVTVTGTEHDHLQYGRVIAPGSLPPVCLELEDLRGLVVAVDGTATDPNAGDVLTYEWVSPCGASFDPGGTNPVQTITISEAYACEVTLRVTDSQGLWCESAFWITPTNFVGRSVMVTSYHAYDDTAQGADTISPFASVFGPITEQDPNGTNGEDTVSLYDFRGLGPAPDGRTYFFLEDIHDGQFDVPGVTLTASQNVRTDNGRNGSDNSGGNTDSVDEDDSGGADGAYGNPRGSMRGASRFDFDEGVLGALPTHVGICASGDGTTCTITAYDGGNNVLQGASIRNTVPPYDPFAGVIVESGIAYVRVSGAAEYDHLQYGRFVSAAGGTVIVVR